MRMHAGSVPMLTLLRTEWLKPLSSLPEQCSILVHVFAGRCPRLCAAISSVATAS